MGQDMIRGNMAMMVLSVLAEGPSYGYRITKTLQERSGGTLTFSTGTLYVTLQRLEAQKLIQSRWETQPNGRERHCFEILPEGRTQLEAAIERWGDQTEKLRAVIETTR